MSSFEAKSVVALNPNEGKSRWVLADLLTFKVTGEQTGGEFAAVELEVEPQNGPPPHIHHREDETFYVLDWKFSFLHGERTFTATSGAFVYIPKGTVHTYKNVGSGKGRLLGIISPAGFEKFLEKIGKPVEDRSSPPGRDPEAVQKLMALVSEFHLEIKAK